MKKLRITVDGKAYDVVVESLDEPAGDSQAPTRSPARSAVTAPAVSASKAPATTGPGAIISPLAGRIVSVDCAPGQQVEAGATLVTLEAMKMNTLIHANAGGKVSEIFVKPGDAVEEGQTLLVVS